MRGHTGAREDARRRLLCCAVVTLAGMIPTPTAESD